MAAMQILKDRFQEYLLLMRFHQPIGILLLLWPTLWALWLASAGLPDKKIFVVFMLGVILMRAAGCIMNDLADRKFDALVKRTKARPLARQAITIYEAIGLLFLTSGLAFLLVLTQCNQLTIEFAFFGAFIAAVYPLLKRITFFPQVGLGIAFALSVPMSFAAIGAVVDLKVWILFIAAALWPIIYDTFYAMVDRSDDIQIQVKSTAIFFAQHELMFIGSLQALMLLMLVVVGLVFHLQPIYFYCLPVVMILFIYQLHLAKNRQAADCFKAFLNNNWVGLTIFIAIVAATNPV